MAAISRPGHLHPLRNPQGKPIPFDTPNQIALNGNLSSATVVVAAISGATAVITGLFVSSAAANTFKLLSPQLASEGDTDVFELVYMAANSSIDINRIITGAGDDYGISIDASATDALSVFAEYSYIQEGSIYSPALYSS